MSRTSTTNSNYHQATRRHLPGDQAPHELSVSRGRIKSAYGRLSTPPLEQVLPEFRSVRRAQSANSTRGMASNVPFPHTGPTAAAQTMYGEHFSGTFSPRANPRPCSPTRRNNPHPTKSFMAWRLPSHNGKAEENEFLLETARQLRRDSSERFYQEYKGEGKHPAEQEDLLTRLAQAPPPLPDTSSSTYGRHDASSFSSRRPSLQGIPGGNSEGFSQYRASQHAPGKSRHLTGKSSSTHHSRSLSESDAQFVKSSLEKQTNRNRTATEPFSVQQSLWKEPDIWHHRTVRDVAPQVIHRTSVFAAPRSKRGQHFRIHPEWPDYD